MASMTENVIPKLVSFQDAMKMLNLSRYKLDQYIEAGKLSAVYVGSRAYLRTEELQEYARPSASVLRSIEELANGVRELSKKVGVIVERSESC